MSCETPRGKYVALAGVEDNAPGCPWVTAERLQQSSRLHLADVDVVVPVTRRHQSPVGAERQVERRTRSPRQLEALSIARHRSDCDDEIIIKSTNLPVKLLRGEGVVAGGVERLLESHGQS
jgi:hypothetical protein